MQKKQSIRFFHFLSLCATWVKKSYGQIVSSFSLRRINIRCIMSKSFALCSEGGNLAKHTTERSRGWEGDKEKNITWKNGGDSRRECIKEANRDILISDLRCLLIVSYHVIAVVALLFFLYLIFRQL